MKLLVDTHIWIWMHQDEKRIGTRARNALEARSNELWISPLSIWELGQLVDADRVVLTGTHSLTEWIDRAFEAVPMTDASLTRTVANEARAVRLDSADPVDRLLAATARVHELTLVTADKRLIGGRGFRTLASR